MSVFTIRDIKHAILSQDGRNVEARRFVNMLIGGAKTFGQTEERVITHLLNAKHSQKSNTTEKTSKVKRKLSMLANEQKQKVTSWFNGYQKTFKKTKDNDICNVFYVELARILNPIYIHNNFRGKELVMQQAKDFAPHLGQALIQIYNNTKLKKNKNSLQLALCPDPEIQMITLPQELPRGSAKPNDLTKLPDTTIGKKRFVAASRLTIIRYWYLTQKHRLPHMQDSNNSTDTMNIPFVFTKLHEIMNNSTRDKEKNIQSAQLDAIHSALPTSNDELGYIEIRKLLKRKKSTQYTNEVKTHFTKMSPTYFNDQTFEKAKSILEKDNSDYDDDNAQPNFNNEVLRTSVEEAQAYVGGIVAYPSNCSRIQTKTQRTFDRNEIAIYIISFFNECQVVPPPKKILCYLYRLYASIRLAEQTYDSSYLTEESDDEDGSLSDNSESGENDGNSNVYDNTSNDKDGSLSDNSESDEDDGNSNVDENTSNDEYGSLSDNSESGENDGNSSVDQNGDIGAGDNRSNNKSNMVSGMTGKYPAGKYIAYKNIGGKRIPNTNKTDSDEKSNESQNDAIDNLNEPTYFKSQDYDNFLDITRYLFTFKKQMIGGMTRGQDVFNGKSHRMNELHNELYDKNNFPKWVRCDPNRSKTKKLFKDWTNFSTIPGIDVRDMFMSDIGELYTQDWLLPIDYLNIIVFHKIKCLVEQDDQCTEEDKYVLQRVPFNRYPSKSIVFCNFKENMVYKKKVNDNDFFSISFEEAVDPHTQKLISMARQKYNERNEKIPNPKVIEDFEKRIQEAKQLLESDKDKNMQGGDINSSQNKKNSLKTIATNQESQNSNKTNTTSQQKQGPSKTIATQPEQVFEGVSGSNRSAYRSQSPLDKPLQDANQLFKKRHVKCGEYHRVAKALEDAIEKYCNYDYLNNQIEQAIEVLKQLYTKRQRTKEREINGSRSYIPCFSERKKKAKCKKHPFEIHPSRTIGTPKIGRPKKTQSLSKKPRNKRKRSYTRLKANFCDWQGGTNEINDDNTLKYKACNFVVSDTKRKRRTCGRKDKTGKWILYNRGQECGVVKRNEKWRVNDNKKAYRVGSQKSSTNIQQKETRKKVRFDISDDKSQQKGRFDIPAISDDKSQQKGTFTTPATSDDKSQQKGRFDIPATSDDKSQQKGTFTTPVISNAQQSVSSLSDLNANSNASRISNPRRDTHPMSSVQSDGKLDISKNEHGRSQNMTATLLNKPSTPNQYSNFNSKDIDLNNLDPEIMMLYNQ